MLLLDPARFDGRLKLISCDQFRFGASFVSFYSQKDTVHCAAADLDLNESPNYPR
jgi:hypothetical protein